MNQNDFAKIIDVVITNFEGGYYHPQMLIDGRVKDSRYGTSGETMFGIDRKNGGALNTSPAGQRFWSIIDMADAKNKWKWNYMGGEHAQKLKSLVAEMMYPQYESLSKKYLSPEAKKIVDSDPRLTLNFAYATWNGAGWFKKFATDINAAVASGIKKPDNLVKVAIDSRTKEGYTKGSSPNSLIAQQGIKMLSVMNTVNSMVFGIVKRNFKTFLVIGGILVLATTIIVITLAKDKK
jgi:hypothetical protein